MAKKKVNRWQIINLAGIVLVCILGLILYVKSSSQKERSVEVTMTASAGEWWYSERQPPAWLANNLHTGDAEYGSNGKKTAEIVSLESYEDGPNRLILARVKLLVSSDGRYKQQNVTIGSVLTFYPNGTKFMGNVIAIEGKNPFKEKQVEVTLKLYNRYPWFADHIQPGDQLKEPSDGRVQLEVLSKEVSLAELTGYNSAGFAVATRDPYKRDITVTLEMLVSIQNGQYFFANYQPVKVGNELYLPMKDYNLYIAKVVSIKD